jgi:thiol-disulfide isomerase/thioredoxin
MMTTATRLLLVLYPSMLLAAAPVLAQASPPSAPPASAPKAAYRIEMPGVHPGARIEFPQMGTFVKGSAVRAFEPGVTYVFDFFNTKCNLCAAAAPNVAEWESLYAAKKFEFIAVTWEKDDVVRGWLADPKHAEHAPARVVSDPAEAAAKAMQYPTFQNQAPRLFVVRDGVVLWYGHPEFAEKPLAEIAAGTWNPETVRAEFIERAQWARALEDIQKKSKDAERTGAWQDVFELYDGVAAALPSRADSLRAQRFVLMIGTANKVDEGYAYGRQLALAAAKDKGVLGNLARGVLEAPTVRRRDVDFAMALAMAADQIGEMKDAKAAEVVALAHFSKGDRNAALEAIDRAIRLQTDPKVRRAYEATRARFQRDNPGPKPAGSGGAAPPRATGS